MAPWPSSALCLCPAHGSLLLSRHLHYCSEPPHVAFAVHDAGRVYSEIQCQTYRKKSDYRSHKDLPLSRCSIGCFTLPKQAANPVVVVNWIKDPKNMAQTKSKFLPNPQPNHTVVNVLLADHATMSRSHAKQAEYRCQDVSSAPKTEFLLSTHLVFGIRSSALKMLCCTRQSHVFDPQRFQKARQEKKCSEGLNWDLN